MYRYRICNLKKLRSKQWENNFFVGILKVTAEKSRIRIRILIKMSRIRNTGKFIVFVFTRASHVGRHNTYRNAISNGTTMFSDTCNTKLKYYTVHKIIAKWNCSIFSRKIRINPKKSKSSQLYGGTDPVWRAGEGEGWGGPGPLCQEGVEGGVTTAHHHQALPRHHAYEQGHSCGNISKGTVRLDWICMSVALKKSSTAIGFWFFNFSFDVNNCSLDYGSSVEYLKNSNIPQSKPK